MLKCPKLHCTFLRLIVHTMLYKKEEILNKTLSDNFFCKVHSYISENARMQENRHVDYKDTCPRHLFSYNIPFSRQYKYSSRYMGSQVSYRHTTHILLLHVPMTITNSGKWRYKKEEKLCKTLPDKCLGLVKCDNIFQSMSF